MTGVTAITGTLKVGACAVIAMNTTGTVQGTALLIPGTTTVTSMSGVKNEPA